MVASVVAVVALVAVVAAVVTAVVAGGDQSQLVITITLSTALGTAALVAAK